MKKSFKINLLKNRILLETMKQQEDGLGGFIPLWEPILFLWASVEPVFSSNSKGRESGLLIHQKPEDARYRVTFRGGPQKEKIFRLWSRCVRLKWGKEILTPISFPCLDPSGRWFHVLVSANRNHDREKKE